MNESTRKVSIDLLEHPQGAATTSAKRMLLTSASACLLLVVAKVDPSEFQLAGVSFRNLTEEMFGYGLAALLLYSCVIFFLHAAVDYVKHRLVVEAYRHTYAIEISNSMAPPDPEEEHYQDQFESETGYKPMTDRRRLTAGLAASRDVLCILLPAAYGVLVLALVIWRMIF